LTMFSNLAFNAGLPRLVGAASVGRATSLLVAARWIGQVVGPALMGIAFARFEGRGVAVALAFDALSFAAVSSVFGAIRIQLGPGDQGEQQGRVGSKEALRFVRKERGILRVLVFLSLQNALILPLLGAMTFFITRYCTHSAENVGVAFSCFAVGAVPGALVASRLGARHLRWGLMSANFACGVAIVLVSLGRGTGLLVIFGCITFAGAAYAFCVSLAHAVRVSLTPDRIRGRVGSMGALLTDALTPIGLVAMGFLVDAVDARAAVLAIGLGAVLLSALWILPWRRNVVTA
jgi:Na+/melibiose symporter-like transporter